MECLFKYKSVKLSCSGGIGLVNVQVVSSACSADHTDHLTNVIVEPLQQSSIALQVVESHLHQHSQIVFKYWIKCLNI